MPRMQFPELGAVDDEDADDMLAWSDNDDENGCNQGPVCKVPVLRETF